MSDAIDQVADRGAGDLAAELLESAHARIAELEADCREAARIAYAYTLDTQTMGEMARALVDLVTLARKQCAKLDGKTKCGICGSYDVAVSLTSEALPCGHSVLSLVKEIEIVADPPKPEPCPFASDGQHCRCPYCCNCVAKREP